MTTMVLLLFFSFWQCSCIYSGSPTRTWSLSCPTKLGLRTNTAYIVSWQRTACVWTESSAPCRQLNPCEKHGPGLSREHHADNSIQPTSDQNPTSTSLSLKCKFAGIGMTENWHHKTCIALTEQSRIAIQKELLHIKHCEHRLHI